MYRKARDVEVCLHSVGLHCSDMSSGETQDSGAGSISCNERAATMYQPYPVKSAAHRK